MLTTKRLFLKRTLFAALACTAAAGLLSGCSKDEGASGAASSEAAASAQSASGDLLSRIKARGVVTIAMEGTWSPWTFHDAKGELTGFDVAVGKAIAQAIGVKAEFIEGKWDGLLAGLDAGRYDLMINGVGITPERQRAYDFSTPYAFDRVAVIVNNDRSDMKTMADLKGKHTANTISSTYAETAEKAGAKVTGVDDLNQTFELLRARRIDATLNSEVTYADYMRAHPDAGIKIAFFVPEAGEIGIPLKKGADTASLRKVVDDTIKAMRDSGELSRLSKEFFSIDITTKK